MGGTALGASGRSNNGLKLDVKTGKLSLWRLFPTFTFTFTFYTKLTVMGARGMGHAGPAGTCSPCPPLVDARAHRHRAAMRMPACMPAGNVEVVSATVGSVGLKVGIGDVNIKTG